MRKPLHVLHTTEYLTNHIVGKKHTPTHRKIVGGMVMIVGIIVAHFGHSNPVISVVTEFLNHTTAAIGVVPFIKFLDNANNN